MNTFFARHTWKIDISSQTRARLWDEQLVAVHYPDHGVGNPHREPDNESLDPNNYLLNHRKVIRALRELAEQGGYVWAQYEGHDESLVGKVSPQTEIHLVRGKWGSNSGRDGREAVLKAVKLKSVQIVRPQDYPLIFSRRPRRGTLQRWWQPGNAIAELVED